MSKVRKPPLKLDPPNDTIITSLSEIYAARRMKASAEAIEKKKLESIKPLINELCTQNPVADNKIQLGDYVVHRVHGTNRNISADLLMARGVSPDIIADCTTKTNYFSYKIDVSVEAEQLEEENAFQRSGIQEIPG